MPYIVAAMPVLFVALWFAVWNYRVARRKLRRWLARPVRTDAELLWESRGVRQAAYQDALRLASGMETRSWATAMYGTPLKIRKRGR